MQRDAKGNLRTRSHSTNSLTELGKRRATGVDSWAYGMLLWAIVHRRRPFEGWKTDDVISHIFETQDAEQLPLELCDPPPPPGREDGRPAEAKGTFCRASVVELLEECWIKEPENRVEFEQINEQIERIKIECYRVEEEARRVASPHEKMLRSTSKYVSAETRDIDVASEIELLDETGTGGFGKVFRGMWAGTEVAVKLLHNQDLNQKLLDEIKGEVQVLQRLHHPNIVMLMGMCTKPPNVSIITEFLGKASKPDADGKVQFINSIEQVLHETSVVLQPPKMREILKDVCRGMAYLNGFKPPILHRDLKPANLLVTKTLQVKICDFGLSVQKSIEDGEGGEGEGVGAVDEDLGGTAPYSAPEVLLGKDLDVFCDVFSFGVIVWEMYTRKRPWESVHAARISQLVGFDDKRLEISAEVAAVPAVEALVKKCWLLKPSERPSFASLISLLETAIT